MYDSGTKHTRVEIVQMLASAFNAPAIKKFGPQNEEQLYNGIDISKEECKKLIKDDIMVAGEALSDLSDIHPAWIVKTIECESPKVIGVILRWLPSRHVRYILDNLPKRIKISLPKLVDSFAIPAPIMRLIKRGFEKKFSLPPKGVFDEKSFESVVHLKSEEFEALFKDLGIHELALAFQNFDNEGMKVLLNRMSVVDARALQQRIKDVKDSEQALMKNAKYTILDVAMDQEDMDKLLVEMGLSAFTKAFEDGKIFDQIQMKLEPKVSFIFKRYLDQHIGANTMTKIRQKVVLERAGKLSRAGQIGQKWTGKLVSDDVEIGVRS